MYKLYNPVEAGVTVVETFPNKVSEMHFVVTQKISEHGGAFQCSFCILLSPFASLTYYIFNSIDMYIYIYLYANAQLISLLTALFI